MPTKPRATPKKAVDAAVDEALPDRAEPITVTFRDAAITVDRDVVMSARFLIAARSGDILSAVVDILGDQSRLFIEQCKPGESFVTVAGEFFAALNLASGAGNSSASRSS